MKTSPLWFGLGSVAVGLIVLLAGCGEAASCWNDIKGRFTSCEDMRRDEIDKRIEESRRDCRWMEIEQPGQWEQTCDPDQKRKF